jgi:hypothetical protein
MKNLINLKWFAPEFSPSFEHGLFQSAKNLNR